MTRRPTTTISFFSGLLLVLLALASPQAASASAGTAHIKVDRPAAKALDYWTKARMRAADPVPTELPGESRGSATPADDEGAPSYVPPAAPGSGADPELLRGSAATGAGTASAARAAMLVNDPTAPKIRAHGKVFFTVVGGDLPGDFVCSGSAVNSRNKSLVTTAGHCVYDAEDGGGRSRNFIFVPSYRGAAATDEEKFPYGVWAAKKLATTKQWKQGANLRYDVGMAIVKRNDAGQRLQSVVGARGIGFSQPRDQSYVAYGYPQLAPFDGKLEYACPSAYEGSDSAGSNGPAPMRISCEMTGGASGGGWIIGDKTLVSVTSYGYGEQPGFLYGPYFSNTVKQLYKSMRGKK